jgi:hypothetical protein
MTKHSGIFRQSDVGQAIVDNNWVGTAPPSIEYLVVAGGGGGVDAHPVQYLEVSHEH